MYIVLCALDGLMCLYLSVFGFLFFFFKQKTAYEVRISDWSSDGCSSDLSHPRELMCRISSTAGIPTAKPPIAAPPMNAMMLNMLCNLQPKKSLGEINPPVVKFAGNAQPLGSLRVVAFKRLQEISGALGCVGGRKSVVSGKDVSGR